jgi:hypothetical protein
MPSTNDLFARYLQAVGFWLPRATKDDILAEISEDLHSQMEDRAASLNRPLNDAEVGEILKQRGRPMVVASAYLPKKSLIGPVFFPSYKLTLKIALGCYLVPWLLTWMGFLIYAPHRLGAPSVRELLRTLGPLWVSGLTVFAIVTLVFYALDRAWSGSKFAEDWNPKQLPRLRMAKPRRRSEDIAVIVFGLVYLIWLLAIRGFPVLIIGPAAYFVSAMPVWLTVYPLFILLAVAGVIEAAISLIHTLPAWEKPAYRIAANCIALWAVWILFHAHTYVVASNPQFAGYATVTNLIVYICVRGVALGLTIATVIEAWKLVQKLQSRSNSAVPRVA